MIAVSAQTSKACASNIMLALFIVTQSSIWVQSEVLPSRQAYGVLPAANLNLPPMLIGSQPPVDSLLANEPNCSRWIWGQCYFNEGYCGEGKQHATRSGDGCRIIGITSRCFKPCQQTLNFKGTFKQEVPDSTFSRGGGILDQGNLWGIDESGKKDSDKNTNKGDDIYAWPSEDSRDLSDEKSFMSKNVDPVQADANGLNNLLEGAEENDGEHCRWYKASWSKCRDGYKMRERKLRTNRGQDRGLTCPSIKRDIKSCGGSSSNDKKKDDVMVMLPGGMGGSSAAAGVSSSGVSTAAKMDAPCKWNQSVRKCDRCDPKTMEKTCTMPLLSGNPMTCGEERKMQVSCK